MNKVIRTKRPGDADHQVVVSDQPLGARDKIPNGDEIVAFRGVFAAWPESDEEGLPPLLACKCLDGRETHGFKTRWERDEACSLKVERIRRWLDSESHLARFVGSAMHESEGKFGTWYGVYERYGPSCAEVLRQSASWSANTAGPEIRNLVEGILVSGLTAIAELALGENDWNTPTSVVHRDIRLPNLLLRSMSPDVRAVLRAGPADLVLIDYGHALDPGAMAMDLTHNTQIVAGPYQPPRLQSVPTPLSGQSPLTDIFSVAQCAVVAATRGRSFGYCRANKQPLSWPVPPPGDETPTRWPDYSTVVVPSDDQWWDAVSPSQKLAIAGLLRAFAKRDASFDAVLADVVAALRPWNEGLAERVRREVGQQASLWDSGRVSPPPCEPTGLADEGLTPTEWADMSGVFLEASSARQPFVPGADCLADGGESERGLGTPSWEKLTAQLGRRPVRRRRTNPNNPDGGSPGQADANGESGGGSPSQGGSQGSDQFASLQDIAARLGKRPIRRRQQQDAPRRLDAATARKATSALPDSEPAGRQRVPGPVADGRIGLAKSGEHGEQGSPRIASGGSVKPDGEVTEIRSAGREALLLAVESTAVLPADLVRGRRDHGRATNDVVAHPMSAARALMVGLAVVLGLVVAGLLLWANSYALPWVLQEELATMDLVICAVPAAVAVLVLLPWSAAARTYTMLAGRQAVGVALGLVALAACDLWARSCEEITYRFVPTRAWDVPHWSQAQWCLWAVLPFCLVVGLCVILLMCRCNHSAVAGRSSHVS
ncbi:MAG: hypothetical protein LBR33_08170 [Propionibacteriaceae bacterium]|jgi:serine/threonine protein kinase|nr:hypothetical protein [Propionibacteriaceae bacterium]